MVSSHQTNNFYYSIIALQLLAYVYMKNTFFVSCGSVMSLKQKQRQKVKKYDDEVASSKCFSNLLHSLMGVKVKHWFTQANTFMIAASMWRNGGSKERREFGKEARRVVFKKQ